ncbi:MAG: 3-hydroxybutyryl-CoA dehydrogenase [Candidatus Thalassarchaeaceae archaeon]|jgi:3-hydroxybutyryl-CoA dehydrogenase|tara:strand:- start:711 stop:1634 length:924 start_codon:yes stop_codon:yes gene_type:complete
MSNAYGPGSMSQHMVIGVVAVIGAGTMGAGIAQISAQCGWETRIFDTSAKSLDTAISNIDSFWDKGISIGKTTQIQKDIWNSKLSIHTELKNAVYGADLVIEAVPEIMELKQELFSKIEELVSSNTILATNTSSLSISEIATATNSPERVIGMHFFNPVPIMKLLEIVRHDLCSEETIEMVKSIGEKMGKTNIIVQDVPGFATSRLGVVLGNEAIRMLAEGVASASDIDTAMMLGYKHPIGPLELSDLVGLDVRKDILSNLASSFSDDTYLPHPLLVEMVSKGELGKKTGKGIYDWSSGSKVDRTKL